MTNEPQGPAPQLDALDALVAGERAAASMTPSASAQEQTWTRVVNSVAVGTAPPLDPSSIGGPAGASAASWMKIVVGLVLTGAVGVVAMVSGVGLSGDPEPPPSAVSHASAEAADPSPDPRSDPPPQLRPPPEPPPPRAATVTATVTAALPVTEAPRNAPTPKARAAPATTKAPSASDLAEETRLLARARARLRADAPRDALAPLAEHARRFPQGQLAEDRMVLRAQALCGAGDVKAGRTEAAALRTAFPDSSHLPRVKRACK